ncbi:DNA alkylation repair protein [Methanospirillum lacunae]|uniref:DNA alkylation repair protein n=1 Tax=Methanospirillum lacunae TaxID=668570 RepID=A0A2V2NDL0_9EURY|nr:DNA alkylation repair protein [Methanospirillum lacunae]PWR74508.1 DNA alkylation repair protein [Methanospirillum lacunae]
MDPIIKKVRRDLIENGHEEIRKGSKRFFKEDILCYGVKTATVGKIAKKYWGEIKNREKQEIFTLCQELYSSGYMEDAFVVSNWMANMSVQLTPADMPTIRSWVSTYITNWAMCDSFCNHAVGDLVDAYPECISELIAWTASDNRWMRRAAAVSLIIPAKHGKFLEESMRIADLLLTDEDDMVQKGYGWLLKEASRKHQQIIFEYVMRNKQKMPRTSLRYAIELMPGDLRKLAMLKDW